MARGVVTAVALVVFGCKDAPKRTEVGKLAPSALPHVPKQIADYLGAAPTTLVVIDATELDRTFLNARIPKALDCLRPIANSARFIVVDVEPKSWQVFATPMPEAPTKECLAKLAPAFNMSFKDPLVHADSGEVELKWHLTTMRARPAKQVIARGQLSHQMRELIAKVPSAYPVWFASMSPSMTMVGWASATRDEIEGTIQVTASDAATARKYVEDLIAGGGDNFRGRGIEVDPTWFQVTTDGNTARLTARLPLGVIVPNRQE